MVRKTWVLSNKRVAAKKNSLKNGKCFMDSESQNISRTAFVNQRILQALTICPELP
jgi:hypothetical protein